jgi:hypothetical protein
MTNKKRRWRARLTVAARKKHPERMNQKQIDKIIEQLITFFERYGEETTSSMQINIYRGGLTGISVFLPKREIKHYTPQDCLTDSAKRDMV